MTGGFQDASTHRQCLVRNSVTMLELRTGVNIPHLESFRHPDATTQQTAQDPINLTLHGCLIHESYPVPGRNSISYLCSSCELSVRGGTEHTLRGRPAHLTRYSGVRLRITRVEDTTQAVTPVGLNHRVSVNAGLKTRPQGDYHPGIIYCRAQVALGHHGIYQPVGLKLSLDVRPGVNKHSDVAVFQALPGFICAHQCPHSATKTDEVLSRDEKCLP